MSDAVVVGPRVVSGPGTVDPDVAAAALECVDDERAVVDDRVVGVDELWRDVLGSATDRSRGDVVLICPSWWSNARVARVVAAAGAWSGDVVVRRRVDVLDPAPAVVELAPELVVVHADGRRRAFTRFGAAGDDVAAIVACVDGLPAVTVDVPSGLAFFGAELVRALRRRAIDVTVVDDRDLVLAACGQRRDTPVWRGVATPRVAVVAVAVLSVAALTVTALALRGPPTDAGDRTWLVEGRIAVEVPARWTVERITSGPGSARVQVVSPMDAAAAIHVTQSRVPGSQTLEEAAATLRDALAAEPDGVFVDFADTGERARRPVVTYREIRADRRIDWTVLLDGGVRIAIGCQGAVDAQCDRAIGSAHAVR